LSVHERLYIVHVVVGDGARRGVDDEVQPCEHGLGEPNVEHRVLAAERALQNLLHALPDVGVVSVARHVDQAGEEAPVGVAPHEEPDALALLEVQYPHRHLEQFLLRDLEQLVTRVRLEDLKQVFLVVTPLREARPL
jgi:hypothetical protein